ncbi:MAG: UDP-2,3-diacylglucosamine diphosphatase LpxI [Nitrospirae bacterium]|nr:UDP-2,3-diacylglucosamine diphosphatase LpxI [Nitrospirota bacterium]MCL5978881.1 UDP-2,3-diacylglucosamine diphosphatase LpxI [Nitrospirota bacterium]
MESIGIIAGRGELPKIIALDAKERGFTVVTVALENLASAELNEASDEIKWINVGKLGDMIDTLKEFEVKKAIMAGKVPKSLLYKSGITPDWRAVKLLFSLKDKTDDSILNAITREMEKEGIDIIDTASFSPHLLTPEGVLTKIRPTDDEWKDIEFGWKIAKEIGKLDIGQTVVVKGRAVMAVEAIEGTDEAILRGGKWAGESAVVVKVSKPHQDMRLDVPVIGSDTLKSMVAVNARILAVEAKRSIIINRAGIVKDAEEAGISIVGVNGAKF